MDEAGRADRYRTMLLIRRFEERLIDLHDQGEVAGHFHVAIGQEATAAAVLGRLGPDDVVYTAHRNHGHLLARGAQPGPMYAEILGRTGGYCRGFGGTLHLAVAELNVPATSALVGGNLPQATGAALSLQRLAPGAVAVCFFGDGSFEEGATHEALNIAAVMGLPLLAVCENNGLAADHGAAGAFPTSASGAERLCDIPRAFSIPSVAVDGADLDAVDTAIGDALTAVRDGAGPRFVETRTVRWPGSRPLWPRMAGGPTDLRWLTGDATPPDEVADWTARCDPLGRALPALACGYAAAAALDAAVRAEIDDAVRWALASPWPDPQQALTGVPGGDAA